MVAVLSSPTPAVRPLFQTSFLRPAYSEPVYETPSGKPSLVTHCDLRLLYPEFNGRSVKLRCPSHGDRGPANLVVFERNTLCMKCGFRESAFEHIRRVKNLPDTPEGKRQLVEILKQIQSQSTPTSSTPTAETAHEADPVQASSPIDPSILPEYEQGLLHYPEVAAYIERRYGLNERTQTAARLGYMEGLAITVPVFGLDGSLQNVRYRSHPDNPSVKYWGVKGRNSAMWFHPPSLRGRTLSEAVRSSYPGKRGIILTEGEMDALALYQIGLASVSITNGCRSLGQSELKKKVGPLLEDLRGLSVSVMYDQDEAGQGSAANLAAHLKALGFDAYVLSWDPSMGKDASEMLAKSKGQMGAAHFRAVVTVKAV